MSDKMSNFDLFSNSFSFSIQEYESSFIMNDENEMSIDNFQQSIISIFDNRHNSQSSIISIFDNRQSQIIKLTKKFQTKHFDFNFHNNKEYVF